MHLEGDSGEGGRGGTQYTGDPDKQAQGVSSFWVFSLVCGSFLAVFPVAPGRHGGEGPGLQFPEPQAPTAKLGSHTMQGKDLTPKYVPFLWKPPPTAANVPLIFLKRFF